MDLSKQNPMGNDTQQLTGNQPQRPAGQPPRQPMGQPPRQPMGQAPRQGGQIPRQPMGHPPRQPIPQQSHQEGQSEHQLINNSAHQATPQQNIQASANGIPPFLTTVKGLAIALGGAVILGLLFGLMMGGGSSSAPKTQCSGFEKLVVRNKDITNRMPLCGRIDKGGACLLYIMNTSRYDETAEKFFQKAAELTGMQKYSIQMVNPQYAKTRIPPGHFVEIKIPPMK